MERVIITEQIINECENDEELCMVAFGQEEDRDLNYILGRTIEVPDECSEDYYLCVFDDQYGNMYYEVEVDGQKYNIPAKYFEKIFTVHEKKEGERNIEVYYNDSITLNGVSKISYTEHVFPGGESFYGYCIFNSNDYIMAQITVDNVLIFEKDNKYNRHILR